MYLGLKLLKIIITCSIFILLHFPSRLKTKSYVDVSFLSVYKSCQLTPSSRFLSRRRKRNIKLHGGYKTGGFSPEPVVAKFYSGIKPNVTSILPLLSKENERVTSGVVDLAAIVRLKKQETLFRTNLSSFVSKCLRKGKIS